jgi:hypothetical protein
VTAPLRHGAMALLARDADEITELRTALQNLLDATDVRHEQHCECKRCLSLASARCDANALLHGETDAR